MTIADKIARAEQDFIDVSNAGYEAGNIDGYDRGYEDGWYDCQENMQPDLDIRYEEGVEAGKQAEYDRFWDTYQTNGTRTNYSYAYNVAFADSLLYPKYDMVPLSCPYMFYQCPANIDLVQRLEECGVTLDFSQSANHNAIFQGSAFTRVGVVDLTTATSQAAYIFESARKLVTIDKLILSPLMTVKYQSMFSYCSRLKNLTIEGGNFNYSVNLQWSPLTLESAISVMTHLVNLWQVGDYNEDGIFESSEYTQTVTFSNDAWEEMNRSLNGLMLGERLDEMLMAAGYEDIYNSGELSNMTTSEFDEIIEDILARDNTSDDHKQFINDCKLVNSTLLAYSDGEDKSIWRIFEYYGGSDISEICQRFCADARGWNYA